jgi:ribosomal-protein-serine acetyltransferase
MGYGNEVKRLGVFDGVVLKQVERSDSAQIFEAIANQREYLGKWLSFVEFSQKVEDIDEYVQSIINVPEDSREYVFVISCNAEFAGLIGFKDTDRANKRTEIGYWISERFQKKGIVTESVKLLSTFAFNELHLNRIQIKCAVGNVSSKRIPLRLGFKLEGIMRDGELLTGGNFTDIEVYSKLRND